jgi:hypothetical protein
MHACIVLGLCEHDIPTACDVPNRASGDFGNAMSSCLAHSPNKVTT